MGSGEAFQILEGIADHLGAAIGASRATDLPWSRAHAAS